MGTKQVATYFPANVARQLCALAVERKTAAQNLMAEVLNNLFANYGSPEAAPIDYLPRYVSTTR